MRSLAWNLCTSFAALGALLAYAILVSMFGLQWELLPGALLGLLVIYAVSTALGNKFSEIGAGQSLLAALALGCAAALLTLFAGALAIGLGNFLVETVQEVLAAPAGQPLWNRLVEFSPHNAFELIFVPLLVGTIFGALPALSLGVAYGVYLYARRDRSETAKQGLGVWAGAGAGLALVLLTGSWYSMYHMVYQPSDWLAGPSTFVSDCGEIALGDGVLSYCRGVPCADGRCDYEQHYDAFAIYVTPPAGAGWSWAGGGIGTTRRADEVGHHLYWVQRNPDGFIDENSPRRHESYRLRLVADQLVAAGQRIPLSPGMLLTVRFDRDWRHSISHGADALRQARMSVGSLQRVLDDACAESPACEQAFQLQFVED